MSADAGETVTYTCACCNWTSEYPRGVLELIQRSRTAQGLPFHVTDPSALAQVAALIASELRLTPERRYRRERRS